MRYRLSDHNGSCPPDRADAVRRGTKASRSRRVVPPIRRACRQPGNLGGTAAHSRRPGEESGVACGEERRHEHRNEGHGKMRSSRQAIGVGVGSYLLLIGATASAAAADPPAVTVSAPLQRELVEWDEFTGQFWAKDSVEIRARVSGYLTKIHFTDGQMVNRGDLLFVIDPRPYEATQAAAQAQLGQDCSGPARGTSARTLRRIAQEG